MHFVSQENLDNQGQRQGRGNLFALENRFFLTSA